MAYCPKIPIANESEIKECNEKKKNLMKEFQQVIGDGWKSFKCCLKGLKKTMVTLEKHILFSTSQSFWCLANRLAH